MIMIFNRHWNCAAHQFCWKINSVFFKCSLSFMKLVSQIRRINAVPELEKRKCWLRNSDLYVVYMLIFCELNRHFSIETWNSRVSPDSNLIPVFSLCEEKLLLSSARWGSTHQEKLIEQKYLQHSKYDGLLSATKVRYSQLNFPRNAGNRCYFPMKYQFFCVF